MAAPVTIIQATVPAAAIAGAPASAGTPAQAGGGDASFANFLQKAGEALDAAQTVTSVARNGSAAPGTEDPAAMLIALLSHQVTPDEAAQILDQLDNAPAQVQAGLRDSDQQLKQQLQEIVFTELPKSVQEILADSTAPEASAAAATALPAAETAQATLGVVAQHMLHFLSKTLGKKEALAETPAEELPQDANATVNANALNPALMLLAAGPFQDHAEEEHEEKPAESEPLVAESSGSLVTTMLPMAQQAVIVQAKSAQATSVVETDEALTTAQAIDTRIPSLKLTGKEETLPVVTLPGEAEKAIAKSSDAAEFKNYISQETGDRPLVLDAQPQDGTKVIAPGAIHPALAGHTNAPAAVGEAAAVTSTPALVNHAPVSDQVSVAIHQANRAGVEKITIQLDPAELGRIEVNLHVARDGHTNLTFLIDKAETFDALARDARHLERSLQEAGIKADTGGMQFNLRQQPQPQQFPTDSNGSGNRQHDSLNDTDGNSSASDKVVQLTPPPQQYRVNIHEGLDIRA